MVQRFRGLIIMDNKGDQQPPYIQDIYIFFENQIQRLFLGTKEKLNTFVVQEILEFKKTKKIMSTYF